MLILLREFGGIVLSSMIKPTVVRPELQAAKEVDILNEQAAKLEPISPEEMLRVATEAYQLSLSADYKTGIARSLAQIGKAHVRLGNLTDADSYLAQAQAIKPIDALLQADILNNRGVCYIYSKIYDKAFVAYQQSLRLARSLGNRTLEARLLNNIGEIYREHKDYATAIDYYNQSIELQSGLQFYPRRSVPFANLSAVYLAMNKLDEAEALAQQALGMAREQKDYMIESVCLQYLGIIAKRKGLKAQAIAYLEASLLIYRGTKETIHATEVLIMFHELYFAGGDIEKSLQYLNEALQAAEEVNSLALRSQIYTEMARVYEHIGDTEKVLFYYKQYQETMLSIDEAERQQRLRAIDTQIIADESFREKETYRLLSEELDRRARELEEAVLTMQAISDIGKSITATLSLDRIFARLHKHLRGLMPTDTFGIGLYNENTNSIEYQYLVEEGRQLIGLEVELESVDSFAVACFKQKQGLLVNSLAEDVSAYVDFVSSIGGPPMPALMFQPLIVEDECIGVITVQNRQENVYNVKTLEVLEMLAAYVSIAIQNAQRLEQLQQLNAELAALSNRDGLTNVANRRYFDQSLQQAWDMGARQQTNVSLLLVDVDYLKEYNDYYGHLPGDDVIKQIARALELSVKRGTDLVARYGGDEFVVLLNDTDSAGALHVASRIQANVAKCNIQVAPECSESRITVSIGVATMVPVFTSRPSELIARSDYALYQAKEAGRNSIRTYLVS